VIVLVIAVRLLLDPATKNYYDSGLVVATALFDVIAVGTVPRLTIAAVVLVYLPSYAMYSEPGIRGVLRTVGLLAIVVMAGVIRPRTRPAVRAPSFGDPVRDSVMTG
jgi:hypothetical protein